MGVLGLFGSLSVVPLAGVVLAMLVLAPDAMGALPVVVVVWTVTAADASAISAAWGGGLLLLGGFRSVCGYGLAEHYVRMHMGLPVLEHWSGRLLS